MEILLNDKFYKIESSGPNRAKFVNIPNEDKVILEKWFNDIHSTFEMGFSKNLKLNTSYINDSDIGELMGVYICSIGDSSENFQIRWDAKQSKTKLRPEYIKGLTFGSDNNRAGIIPEPQEK